MAGFLCLQEPTKAMRLEAASAGRYECGGISYDRMQLLTVKDIIEGKRYFDSPVKLVTRVSTGQASLPLTL